LFRQAFFASTPHRAIEETLGKRKTQQLKRLLEELIAGSSQG
jgi:hypothetical protein